VKHELWYSVVVRDRNGKVISRERRRARSFLKQWNQIIYVQMAQTSLNITDNNGVSQSIEPFGGRLQMRYIAGDTKLGIVVGLASDAVAIDDYALGSLIAEGTGVNQMNYLICTVATSVVAAPSCYFIVSRSIVNNSAAEITVREAGIHATLESGKYGLMTRDVFGTPQAVPIGGTITVNWAIKVTV